MISRKRNQKKNSNKFNVYFSLYFIDYDIMKERIIKMNVSNRKGKKYKVIVMNKKSKKLRTIHFGASSYEQYKDTTKIKKYKSKNHLDIKRRRNYFLRHSGVTNKTTALKKEIKKNNGFYNPKILSHTYLW